MTANERKECMTENGTGSMSLYSKLAAVMSEIGYVEKRGRNEFHGYNYATEADLADAVRSKLAERNVMLIPSLTNVNERAIKTAKGKDSTLTTARISFTFCDGDSGQTHTADWAGAGDDPADKGLYKAMTGAAKYFLMKSFLIPTGDDPEHDSRRPEEVGPPSFGPAFGPEANADQLASLQRAIAYLLELRDDSPVIGFIVESLKTKVGYVPWIAVQSAGILAAALKDMREPAGVVEPAQ